MFPHGITACLTISKELTKSRDPHNRPIVCQRTSSSPQVDEGLSRVTYAAETINLLSHSSTCLPLVRQLCLFLIVMA